MKKRKLSIICLAITTFAFLVFSVIAVYAQDELSIREKKRNAIPVERMMINLEKPIREKNMQPEKVLDVFKVKEGDRIADIGAGTGFFSFRLAARVGAGGKVYAVEIEDKLLDYIRGKMEKDKVTNISLVKSSDAGPNLAPGSCDKIMIIGSYYYFQDPVGFMKNVRKALKPGGLVAVIDLDKEKVVIENPKSKNLILKVRLKNEVIDEMKTAGFVFRESHDFLDKRFFMIFSTED